MKLIFENPVDLSPEIMKQQIKDCKTPALMLDLKLNVITCNSGARDVLKIGEDGGLLSVLPPQDYLDLQKMNIGQIGRVELGAKSKCGYLSVRFADYYVLIREKSVGGHINKAIEIKNDSEKRLKEVDEFFARLGDVGYKDEDYCAHIRSQQMFRRSNAVDMLDMVSDVSLRNRCSFEPGLQLSEAVKYAREVFEEEDIYIGSSLVPSPYCCSGIQDDFYTTLAVLFSIGAENSNNGRINVKGTYSMYRYIIQISFTFSSSRGISTATIEEQLALISCIADSNGWYLRHTVAEGKAVFMLILPCNEESNLYLRAPQKGNYDRFLFALQATPYFNKKRKL